MAKNWTHLFEKYRGKWVALAEDETTVLAAAETAIVLSFFIGRSRTPAHPEGRSR